MHQMLQCYRYQICRSWSKRRLYHDGLGTPQSQRASIPRLFTPRTILKDTRREGGREGGVRKREGGKEGIKRRREGRERRREGLGGKAINNDYS